MQIRVQAHDPEWAQSFEVEAESLRRTLMRRPDLLEAADLTPRELIWLEELRREFADE